MLLSPKEPTTCPNDNQQLILDEEKKKYFSYFS
jgi:hypothetical protein